MIFKKYIFFCIAIIAHGTIAMEIKTRNMNPINPLDEIIYPAQNILGGGDYPAIQFALKQDKIDEKFDLSHLANMAAGIELKEKVKIGIAIHPTKAQNIDTQIPESIQEKAKKVVFTMKQLHNFEAKPNFKYGNGCKKVIFHLPPENIKVIYTTDREYTPFAASVVDLSYELHDLLWKMYLKEVTWPAKRFLSISDQTGCKLLSNELFNGMFETKDGGCSYKLKAEYKTPVQKPKEEVRAKKVSWSEYFSSFLSKDDGYDYYQEPDLSFIKQKAKEEKSSDFVIVIDKKYVEEPYVLNE